MSILRFPGFKVRTRLRTLDQIRAYTSLVIMGKRNRRSLQSFSDAVIAAKRTHELDARGSIAYMMPFLKEGK